MTRDFLSSEQIETFARDGVLRLPRLLSAEGARAARQAVLRPLETLGLWREGRWRLDAVPRPVWPLTGPKTATAIGHRHPELRALVSEPPVQAVVSSLLGGAALDPSQRPQVLFSLPNIDAWTIPNGWHLDVPRLASGRSPGVQLFTFLDPVEPGGGGTLVVAGSHRLVKDGRHAKAKDVQRRLAHEPFFRELYSRTPGPPAERAELMRRRARMEGVELELVELTGAPGDAWFVDLGVLHATAPNAAVRPRLMLTQRFVRADVTHELAEAYGWT